MKSRLATLIEREDGGKRYMSGKLGDAIIVLELDGLTRDNQQRWRLMLATPKRPNSEAAHNRTAASWRIERRKAEGIEKTGGWDGE